MNKKNVQISIFWDLLAVAFIVLKITGAITWSWWWVLAPIWAPVALGLIILIIAVIIAALASK